MKQLIVQFEGAGPPSASSVPVLVYSSKHPVVEGDRFVVRGVRAKTKYTVRCLRVVPNNQQVATHGRKVRQTKAVVELLHEGPELTEAEEARMSLALAGKLKRTIRRVGR